ncbi:MAG: hypothetical protein ACK501_06895 [Planctomycetota bacterium]|jgi:hypothetical protein
MRISPACVAFTLLALAACGAKVALAATDLHGTWTQGVEHGYVLEFDPKSDKFLVHGPGAGGHDSHDHFGGSYRVDGAAVVLDGKWESDGKAETVRGALRDGTLQVTLQGKVVDLRRK